MQLAKQEQLATRKSYFTNPLNTLIKETLIEGSYRFLSFLIIFLIVLNSLYTVARSAAKAGCFSGGRGKPGYKRGYKRSVGREPAASMPMAATLEPHDLTCVLLTCVDLRFTPAVKKTDHGDHPVHRKSSRFSLAKTPDIFLARPVLLHV